MRIAPLVPETSALNHLAISAEVLSMGIEPMTYSVPVVRLATYRVKESLYL